MGKRLNYAELHHNKGVIATHLLIKKDLKKECGNDVFRNFCTEFKNNLSKNYFGVDGRYNSEKEFEITLYQYIAKRKKSLYSHINEIERAVWQVIKGMSKKTAALDMENLHLNVNMNHTKYMLYQYEYEYIEREYSFNYQDYIHFDNQKADEYIYHAIVENDEYDIIVNKHYHQMMALLDRCGVDENELLISNMQDNSQKYFDELIGLYYKSLDIEFKTPFKFVNQTLKDQFRVILEQNDFPIVIYKDDLEKWFYFKVAETANPTELFNKIQKILLETVKLSNCILTKRSERDNSPTVVLK